MLQIDFEKKVDGYRKNMLKIISPQKPYRNLVKAKDESVGTDKTNNR